MVAAALLAFTAPAHAEDSDVVAVADDDGRDPESGDVLPRERGWVEVSAFLPNVDTRLRIDEQGGPVGTEIDFESDLRLSRRKVLPAVSAGVWLSRNWALFGEFYEVSRSQNTTLSEEIVFDGEVFPANADVTGRFGSQIFRLGVRHSLHRDANTEIDLSLGAHVTAFEAGIEGEIQAGNTAAQTARRRREVLAPLPTLGLYMRQEVAPRVDLSLQADAFRIELGDVEGRIVNFQATASYRLGRSFALGLAYRQIDYRLTVDKDDWSGRAKYGFSGPAVSLRYTW
ncbi:MAG: hypothetical protein V2I74_08230 [Erythrobacter sp.]|jgi:hypothetical protein|nr:hypothetical protein [Erythrobacter sp.]